MDLAGGFWATPAIEPASSSVRTRVHLRIIQDQPLNSDWMPRLTLESLAILSVIPSARKRICGPSAERSEPLKFEQNTLYLKLLGRREKEKVKAD